MGPGPVRTYTDPGPICCFTGLYASGSKASRMA